MIRLGIILVVVVYLVMVLVPGADHGEGVEVTRTEGQNWLVSMITGAEEQASRPPTEELARSLHSELTDDLIETETGYALETASGELLDITAVINPVDLLPDEGDSTIGAVSVVDPGAVEIIQQQAAENRIIWRVTGSNVNFRAGPSTSTAILAGLVRGDQVEFLADAPDGWAHLRVLDSGLEGYMAARFLEPVN